MEQQEIKDYIKAGQIASKVKQFALKFVKPNMPLLEIAEAIENKIKELGGQPAFPVNLSINETAAHCTPAPNDTAIARGLLKIDIGVSVNGYIADMAFSIDLTHNNEFKEMIELNKKALESALKKLKPSIEIKEIGNAVQETINNPKFSIIKNLSGHSLGKNQIHAGLTLSNYKNNNTKKLNNIAIAIEPFLTQGIGQVYEGKQSEIFMLQKDGAVRDADARKLLKFIKENYSTLPFCKRWLAGKFKKLNFSLSILTRQGILHNFPVLIEKSKKPVSQAEHTILILDDKVIITTK